MKDEIYYGLKNALERGQDLKQGVQSFINAGYNPLEVRAAARMLSEGASQIIEKSELDVSKSEEQKVEKKEYAPLPSNRTIGIGRKEPSKGKRILIVGLIFICSAMILSVLGLLIYYFLK